MSSSTTAPNQSPPESRDPAVPEPSPVSSLRVDRLLARTSNRYPFGIPERAIVEAKERRSKELALRKKVLFLVASATSSVSEEEEALLTSIVEKGLALTKEQVAIQVCDLTKCGNEVVEWLRAKSIEFPAIVVIAMGFQQSPHGAWTGGDPQVLHTVSLPEVISSKESKRLFWGHLQGVISRIKA